MINFQKIRDIKITYYNAEGKVIKKVKNSEIEDYSATSGSTVYDDSRVKVYKPQSFDYPFTVEYSYTKDLKSLMFVPSFIPL